MWHVGVIAFGLGLVLTPTVISGLRHAGVLDSPGARSLHRLPTVRGAGLAVAVAATFAFLMSGDVGRPGSVIVAATAVLAILGGADDLQGGLSPRLRLVAQLVVAVVGSYLVIESGVADLPMVLVPVAAVAVAGYVNAFNFMDGIDGISAIQAIVGGAVFVVLGHRVHEPVLQAAGVAVAGASLGFLPYNAPRARCFLGDVGSYFLGGWLAFGAVVAVALGVPVEAATGVFAVYVGDTSTTVVRRLWRGEQWYEAHREHAYQRLVQSGWSHLPTALVVGVASAFTGALGMVSLRGSAGERLVAGFGIAAVVTVYLALPSVVARTSNE